MTLMITCNVCDDYYSWRREHCPTCGSARKFLASHSYERQSTEIRCWNLARNCEVIKANAHTFCVDEDAILTGTDPDQ